MPGAHDSTLIMKQVSGSDSSMGCSEPKFGVKKTVDWREGPCEDWWEQTQITCFSVGGLLPRFIHTCNSHLL